MHDMRALRHTLMLQCSIKILHCRLARGCVQGALMKERMVRIDRIAGEMNAWLLALAIGLGMLDLTVLVAKSLPPLPQMQVPAANTAADSAPPAVPKQAAQPR